MERLLLPLKQNFTTLCDFLNYMRACVQAAIISRMASLNTAEGKAWEKEHNKLIELHQETSTLTLEMVQQVVKLAENHLALIKLQSQGSANDTVAASVLSTEMSPASTNLEEQVTLQAVAREQAVPTSKSRPKFQQGKNLKSSLKRPFKATQNALDKAKNKTPATPCTTCGKLHCGKCIHLRDLDKEQQKLDRAHKLKAAIAKGTGVEAAYVSRIREMEELDDNEDNDLCSRLTICTALPVSPSAAPGQILLAPCDPCLDSGSPVDITSNPAYAHLTGGKVKLSGVTGNAQFTERALVSYPIRTESGCAVRVKTRGPGLYLSSDNILSMALLLKTGHDVRLKAGSPEDPEDGGIIYLTDCDTICLSFVGDVWSLPLAAEGVSDVESMPQFGNLGPVDSRQVSVLQLELTSTEQVQVYHNAWGHPSNS
eukprot:1579339-Rhodomonas_salina.1